jgi:hypothetical protein
MPVITRIATDAPPRSARTRRMVSSVGVPGMTKSSTIASGSARVA